MIIPTPRPLPTWRPPFATLLALRLASVLIFLFAIFHFASYWPSSALSGMAIWISEGLLLLLLITTFGLLPLYGRQADRVLSWAVPSWVLLVSGWLTLVGLTNYEGFWNAPARLLLGASCALLFFRYTQVHHQRGRTALCLVLATLFCWCINLLINFSHLWFNWNSRALTWIFWLSIVITIAALVVFLPPKLRTDVIQRRLKGELKDEPLFEQLDIRQDWVLLSCFIGQMMLTIYVLQIDHSAYLNHHPHWLGMGALLFLTTSLALFFEQHNRTSSSV